MDIHNSALITETGFYDAQNKRFIFRGSHRDPASGKVVHGVGELDISNPDYHVYTSYIIGADGAKKKQFEGVTRRKASAKAKKH